MEILSNYEEQPESIKKPFNSVLNIVEQFKFIEKTFVAKETNLFMSGFVVKNVNRLVRSIKEKLDDEEKKRKEKSDGVDLKVKNKRIMEEEKSTAIWIMRVFVSACWRISSTTTDVHMCDASIAACYDMKTVLAAI
ncbi:hypothetical protein Tco_0233525 [Tanacetum coccineum]